MIEQGVELTCGHEWLDVGRRMLREIVYFGDPVLRKKCANVELSPEHKELADDMIETMREAHGVGLAAPQIGIPIQMAVVDVSHDPECISFLRVDGKDTTLEELMPLVFVNPELTFGDEKASESEGCLSIPEVRADVLRPAELKAELTLLDGSKIVVETDGLLARAIQHETDHLNGVLFVDRIKATAKARLRTTLRRFQQEYKERERRKKWQR
mgnify:CR=1 FL=1